MNLVSKLRSNKWRCEEQLGYDSEGKDRGICGDVAAYRCNACRKRFCLECWADHLEMSVVMENGASAEKQEGRHG